MSEDIAIMSLTLALLAYVWGTGYVYGRQHAKINGKSHGKDGGVKMSTKEFACAILAGLVALCTFLLYSGGQGKNICESIVFENISKFVVLNSSGQEAIVLGMNGCKDGEYLIKIGYKDYNYQSVVLESEVTYK